jgi:hypothetical protein
MGAKLGLEHRWRVFQNDESVWITLGWRKLHIERLQNICTLLGILLRCQIKKDEMNGTWRRLEMRTNFSLKTRREETTLET